MAMLAHFLLFVTAAAADPPQGSQYNILFITTDQQRTSTLNCYNNSWAHSPNIDRLAADGVLFKEAYTASPVCAPSRTSMLTGVHVPIHGIYENGIKPYRDGLTPYFDKLKEMDYHTALIGKTHFEPVPRTIDHLIVETGMRQPGTPAEKFLETYLVNETMAFIDSVRPDEEGAKDTDRPFFAYLSMLSPHPPCVVPPGPWAHVYDNVTLPKLNYRKGNVADLPYQDRMLLSLLGKENSDPPAFPGGDPNMSYIDQPVGVGTRLNKGRYNYYAQAAYVDFEVGRILDFLDARNLTNSTLVIFSSDHGSQMFDHGIGNDKHVFLDASLRVPLIMRLPGVLPAATTRDFASLLDVTATILTAAGAELPADYQGFDLLAPLAQGKPSPRKVGIATEYLSHAVVTPTWKLAYYPEQDEGRLWNRIEDPDEQHDLFSCADGDTAHARDGLLRALLRWRAEQNPIGWMGQQSPAPGRGPHGARNAANYTRHLRAIDAEIALQDSALQFEHLGSPKTLTSCAAMSLQSEHLGSPRTLTSYAAVLAQGVVLVLLLVVLLFLCRYCPPASRTKVPPVGREVSQRAPLVSERLP